MQIQQFSVRFPQKILNFSENTNIIAAATPPQPRRIAAAPSANPPRPPRPRRAYLILTGFRLISAAAGEFYDQPLYR
jgi:hypothetical protein